MHFFLLTYSPSYILHYTSHSCISRASDKCSGTQYCSDSGFYMKCSIHLYPLTLHLYTCILLRTDTHHYITLHQRLDANETVMCFKQEFLFLLSRWPQFFLSRYRSDVRIAFLSKRVPHLHAAIFLSLLTKHGSDGRNRPTPESPVFRLRSRKWRQSSWWIETSWRESALLRGRGSDLVMFGLRSKS